ncbi:ATP-binding cassette domain-containing protein [Candidatus Heimdallarchaeota archaeon]|nr:MAG: ATP-binding cassette domain-containing protein [Candidatus Heimdallarchaeota archaeon]
MSVILRNVKYDFRTKNQQRRILKGVNLDVKQGEFCSIYGPSGSGKTTLLQIIATLLHPFEGDRILFSKPYTNNCEQKELDNVRSRIGYLFQSPYIPHNLKIIEYLTLQAEISGVGLRTARENVISLSKSLDMFEFLQKKPSELSGGEKQRIALIGVLIKDVDLLLLDEPTGSMDFENKESLWDIISEKRNSNLTIIAVSHDDLLKNKTDRSFRLQHGVLK